MMEGAFTQQKKANPAALAIVVLMHGAALTALALAKGEVIVDAITRTKVFNVEPDKVPPPEPVEPVVKKTPPETVVTHTPPLVQILPRPAEVTLKPLPPVQEIVIADPPEVPAPRIEIAPPADPVRTVKPARAKANLASYVSDEDYPTTAVRNEEQGTTRFRLVVGPNGQVTECSIVGSSGSSALDSATCRLMKQRAKFTPARNSAGEPTSDSVTSAIRWVLPD
ncbi:MAG TPA: TonB family protein [Allosphingosinicella sp.]|jgi:protein TonB